LLRGLLHLPSLSRAKTAIAFRLTADCVYSI
jgi:hypothetical protein